MQGLGGGMPCAGRVAGAILQQTEGLRCERPKSIARGIATENQPTCCEGSEHLCLEPVSRLERHQPAANFAGQRYVAFCGIYPVPAREPVRMVRGADISHARG